MQRSDFENSLLRPLEFWGKKTACEVNALLGDTVSQMVGFDQNNPHHCYDLMMHSLHVIEGLPETALMALRIAAFFHDIGKPSVVMAKQGRNVFYGHAGKSAELARNILIGLGYTESETEEICFYILHHDDFISWVLPEEEYDHNNKYRIPITIDNLRKHIEKVGSGPSDQCWENLLQLCDADASAQAEQVYQNGVLVDSKVHKLQKNVRLSELLKCL